MHKTDDVLHTIEAIHYKLTAFGDFGYVTKNRLKLVEDIDFSHIYHGICCLGKPAAARGHNELNDTAILTGSNNYFLSSNSREFYAERSENNLSSFITSKLLHPISEDYGCEMFVWDRVGDSKYYRKYVPSGIVLAGEIIESEMTVQIRYIE